MWSVPGLMSRHRISILLTPRKSCFPIQRQTNDYGSTFFSCCRNNPCHTFGACTLFKVHRCLSYWMDTLTVWGCETRNL
ncbi:uncharacterized protein FOMMEDRAFT_142221 [Fomitiporia mediterranea MF3/22]|uniref:uncharacterized protein n=1 Tax=Fomitiporia mediterranea (strain MF3/22) TaxID=694068 RepID=UPI0004408D63|nr:uncharacterized protein FOMMEDRAFT_142221 [Fomitiporia mediterranea MF3/22]EJD01668.1 hypothetical protein FOMMEDRAFT_142221 [Fomitiporia mediterranea MF3/22]